MERKPDIQYIGQFYIHGSEARELARQEQARRAKTRLPLSRLQNVQKVYVDPVAVIGIVVAVVMLVVMAIGAIQIYKAWDEYQIMTEYLSDLKRENTALEHSYRSGYDLEDIREKAITLGMVPVEEAQTIQVRVTVPEIEAEPTWWEDFVWFLEGLLE